MSTARDGKRWPLTVQMSLLFATVMVLMVLAVSGLMYVELVHELRDKEVAELREDLALQSVIIAAAAANESPAYWQREWLEYGKVHGQFAWQLVAANGVVRAASANWPAFAQALARIQPPPQWLQWAAAYLAAPRSILVETIGAGRPAGDGSRLRGALDISQDVQVLDAYRSKLLLLGLLASVLSAALAWSLAHHGLAPLGLLGRAIGQANVQASPPLSIAPCLPRELCQLAATFDAMRETVARSSARLSKISSDFADELRAPIENMMAASSVMLSRTRDAADYEQTLDVVLAEGRHLSHLLTDMLFLVRADNGEQIVRPQMLALDQELRKLVDFFELSFEERGAVLQAEGRCGLNADPVLLRRAMSIVLARLLRHASAGDTVRLSCGAAPNTTVVSIAASGAVAAATPVLFLVDWFQRTDATRSAVEHAGIELAVVGSILRLHGGAVGANGGAGEDVRIVFRFPDNPVVDPGNAARAGRPSP